MPSFFLEYYNIFFILFYWHPSAVAAEPNVHTGPVVESTSVPAPEKSGHAVDAVVPCSAYVKTDSISSESIRTFA